MGQDGSESGCRVDNGLQSFDVSQHRRTDLRPRTCVDTKPEHDGSELALATMPPIITVTCGNPGVRNHTRARGIGMDVISRIVRRIEVVRKPCRGPGLS